MLICFFFHLNTLICADISLDVNQVIKKSKYVTEDFLLTLPHIFPQVFLRSQASPLRSPLMSNSKFLHLSYLQKVHLYHRVIKICILIQALPLTSCVAWIKFSVFLRVIFRLSEKVHLKIFSYFQTKEKKWEKKYPNIP